MLLLFYQVYAIIKVLYRQKKNNMHKESTSKASDPYKFLDLATKFDPIFNPDGTIKEHRNALRGINHVETTIVNDTNETIAIFNGELTKSKHFADNEKPRYPGPIDACIYLDKSARPVCDIVAQLWDSLSPQLPTTISLHHRFSTSIKNFSLLVWATLRIFKNQTSMILT